MATVGATSRDYLDLNAWVADLPATYTADQTAELYNDSEFTGTAQVTISGPDPDGFATLIKAAAGEGFNASEQALRYNVSNGVGIRKTNSYNAVFSIGMAGVTVEGLQIGTTGTTNTQGVSTTVDATFKDCIIESSSNSNAVNIGTTSGTTFINTVIHVNDGAAAGAIGIKGNFVSYNLYNCTLISTFPSSTANGADKTGAGADSSIIKNTGIFGFGTALDTGTWGAGTDYNATDDTTLPAGSNNQTSLTTSDQFENVASDATLDLRLKSGNSLDNNGTPDSGNTGDLDIFGNARSVTTPSIGAYETAASGAVEVNDTTANINITSINESVSIPTIVSDSLSNINIASIDETVTLVGAVTVNDSLSNINISALNETITLVGSVTVADSLVNISVTSLNETVSLAGSVTVNDTTGAITITSNDETVTISNAISVSDTTSNINIASNNETVSIVGSVSVNDSIVNINISSLDETVLLSNPVVVSDSLANINISSLDETVTLVGAVSVSDTLKDISVTSNNESVTIGLVTVTPLTYTITFKADNYGIIFKEDTYTIKFGE